MTDHCIVIPGDWTSAGSLWEFVIDKKKMSRIVPVRAGMSLCELQSNVVQEFFTFTVPAPQAVLSYWSPNMKELATGLTTPPVVLINDGAVSFFFQHLAVHKTMNLFDTFNSEGVNQQDTQVGDNVYPFTTPNQTPYPNLNPFRPSSSSSFKIPSFSLFDEDELLQDSPLEPSNVNTSPHHIHQANPHRVSVQDETLSCGDEMLEEMFKEDPDNIPDTWLLDEEDATEPENSQPPDPIPERGYDKDFWEPLIKEHLGGSHAAEVMAGIHVPKTAPETYQSYTGNAFDHPVRVSGVDDTDWKKDLDFMSVHQREGPPVQCKTPNTRVRRADPNTLGPDVHTQSPYTDTSSDSPYTPLYGVHSGLTSTHTRNNLLSPRTPRVFGHPYTVALDNKFCPCQVFQKLKIPCGHALLVADSIGLPHVQLVGECFKTLTWKDTYCGVIYPEAPFGEFTIPPAILSLNLQPPNTRRPSGRPKDKRIPSTSEIQAPKKTKINRCGRCGHSGHNRTNCDVPI
ncbi:unnamed protein product [Brassica rapa subsp. narinosa]